jgi:sulfite reductase (NADPH) hemoprotein beta-component/sulfite reductase (ferredoxin)
MSNAEEIKSSSRQLRGTLHQTLSENSLPGFSDADKIILKFHGLSQYRERGQAQPAEGSNQSVSAQPLFAVRCKIPGGELSAAQFLSLDALASLGNGTLRLTTRQNLQFHGVTKANLADLLAGIAAAGLSTWGAAGDVARNVSVTAVPLQEPLDGEVRQMAREVSVALEAEKSAYREVWFGGEALPANKPATPDPLYQTAYLPRKLKLAVAVPPCNDVDAFAQDLSFVAHAPNGVLEGYTVLAGGGMSIDPSRPGSQPVLAQPLFFVQKTAAVAAARAALEVFREFGGRTNRRRARLKFLIADKGLDWFRAQVQTRLQAATFPPQIFQFTGSTDPLGWQPQGPDKFFFGLRIEGGRIKDDDRRKGIRSILEQFGCPLRLTASHNILFFNLARNQRAAFEAALKKHGLATAQTTTAARQRCLACVALPSCPSALAESERILPGVMAQIDQLLLELGLEKEPLVFRLSGCPNGCSRPYLADIAFVGRGPARYAVYAGGSSTKNRLATLALESPVPQAELTASIRPILQNFVAGRKPGEPFSAYWARSFLNA